MLMVQADYVYSVWIGRKGTGGEMPVLEKLLGDGDGNSRVADRTGFGDSERRFKLVDAEALSLLANRQATRDLTGLLFSREGLVDPGRRERDAKIIGVLATHPETDFPQANAA